MSINILFCFDHNEEIEVPNADDPAHQICTLYRVWAVFIGWQQSCDGDHRAMFNICGHSSRRGSTVTANTLLRLGIKMPAVPPCPFPEKS